MEKKHFSLGTVENNKVIKVFRIAFGIICLIVAVFWLIFNFKTLKADGTLWITILFLTGFGLYQIWSGLGKAVKFIEIGAKNILLKKNSIFPAVLLESEDIEKIEVYPMNIIFFMKSGKRTLLRFGSTFHDINTLVREEILNFAETNKVPFEIIEENI